MKPGNLIKRALRDLIERVLGAKGYDVIPHDTRNYHLLRRALLFKTYQIDLVLDVRASDGGYARGIRANGYHGRIYSFEPRAAAFRALKESSLSDKKWDAMNCALGKANGSFDIHISENGDSSSILELAQGSGSESVQVSYIGKERVSVATLDGLFDSIRQNSKNILLKMDVQGFEREVLAGAEHSLAFIDTIQLELALTPTYQKQMHLHQMCGLLHQKGYTMVSVEPGSHNLRTGQQFEVDGLFHRYAGPRGALA
jgi:FkbM family methyltransferase